MHPMREDLHRSAVVYAVIVSYHPDFDKLADLLDSLVLQVQGVVIVDNGSSEDVDSWAYGRQLSLTVCAVTLGKNMGIARAQNEGIRTARKAGATHVILFDQDSAPASDMVDRLLMIALHQAAQGIKVGGIGPNYLDSRQGNPPPFIKISGLRVQRQQCINSKSVVDVDYLIASGCLIPMDTLDEVGGMRDDLFIDYVDIEWGLRAKTLGYQSYGVCDAAMAHDLGDQPIQFLGKRYPLHSPVRHYYHFRNAMWMYRQSWLPLNWRVADGWRLFLKFGFYSLFAKPRLLHLKMMTRGILHGIVGRMGKL